MADAVADSRSRNLSRGVWQHRRRLGSKFTREMMLRARIDSIREGAHLDNNEHRSAVAIRFGQIANEALDADQFERAWRNILSGERLIFESYSDEQMTARASALAAEAVSMLPASDAKPILDILARIIADQNRTPDWRDSVIETQLLFERRVIFLNDTKERTEVRIYILVAIMSVSLVSFLLLLCRNPDLLASLYDENVAKSGMTASMLIGTAILGSLGACLSALLSFTTLGRAPGIYESIWVTIARPVVGWPSSPSAR
jgi:hypothetical protein